MRCRREEKLDETARIHHACWQRGCHMAACSPCAAARPDAANRRDQKMNMGKAYKQAIKRVFGEKYHDERMAVYWGRDDDSIQVIARLTHYVHKITSENEDTLEFVSSAGDRIIVALTDEERRAI
jgi:hypothetical protein